MTSQTISSMEANRLYWLGRYAERAYFSLHMLRKCYDKSIDGDESSFAQYDRVMGIDPSEDIGKAHAGILYNSNDPSSLISCLHKAKDNAIVLRSYITSETLAYIELAVAKIEECAKKEEKNITALQPVTDYLLAFGGSISERISQSKVRRMLVIGRLIEYIDMHLRFLYPWSHIKDAYERLLEKARLEDSLVDFHIQGELNHLLQDKDYQIKNDDYRFTVLKYLGQLIRI